MKPFEVIKSFGSGKEEYVVDFWERVYAVYGDTYNDVSRCSGCKKFELDYNLFVSILRTVL